MFAIPFLVNFLMPVTDGYVSVATPFFQPKQISSTRNPSFLSACNTSRRSLLTGTASIVASCLLAPETSLAETVGDDISDDDLIEVYFGCGCFWHVQHEFVEAEKRILGRSDLELTSRAGYAGGKGGSKDGKVCYHNAGQISDYGSLGHGEVVRLKIPSKSFPDFAAEYFKLFNEKGDRPDQFGDVGLEYRNLVGVPGGVKSKYASQLVEVSIKNGDKLDFSKGRGSDPDARAAAFVMDTVEYPFFVAESYHQFHDGFAMGENYPSSYNDIAKVLAKEEKLGLSKCPNGLLGVGIGGL